MENSGEEKTLGHSHSADGQGSRRSCVVMSFLKLWSSEGTLGVVVATSLLFGAEKLRPREGKQLDQVEWELVTELGLKSRAPVSTAPQCSFQCMMLPPLFFAL